MNESKSETAHHVWSGVRNAVNGTTFFRSNFFIFLLGQLITAAIGIGAFLIAYGSNTQKFIDVSTRVGALEATGKRMDDTGTIFSHYSIKSFDQRMTGIEARLASTEEQIKRIAVMDEKLTRIDKTVDEIRNNTRK